MMFIKCYHWTSAFHVSWHPKGLLKPYSAQRAARWRYVSRAVLGAYARSFGCPKHRRDSTATWPQNAAFSCFLLQSCHLNQIYCRNSETASALQPLRVYTDSPVPGFPRTASKSPFKFHGFCYLLSPYFEFQMKRLDCNKEETPQLFYIEGCPSERKKVHIARLNFSASQGDSFPESQTTRTTW